VLDKRIPCELEHYGGESNHLAKVSQLHVTMHVCPYNKLG
jgi:hypothetical protein